MSGLRWLVRWGTYPILLGGGMAWLIVALRLNLASEETLVLGTLIATFVLVLVLERVAPFTPEWHVTLDEPVVRVDMLHTLLSTGALSAGIKAALMAGLVFLSIELSRVVGAGLWPSDWPLAAQLLLALTVGEFGTYWVHRLCHRFALLWRIHAMHHSAERLYVVASGRNHPFNVLASFGGQTAPVILLGGGPEVLALHAAFTGINGFLQHCNVDVRAGILNWIVATSHHHRFHHSVDLAESNTNFGNNLIVWDRLFGTHFDPGHPPGAAVGIAGVPFPRTYLGQLASPFTYPRFAGGAEPKPALCLETVYEKNRIRDAGARIGREKGCASRSKEESGRELRPGVRATGPHALCPGSLDPQRSRGG